MTGSITSMKVGIMALELVIRLLKILSLGCGVLVLGSGIYYITAIHSDIFNVGTADLLYSNNLL